MSAEVIEKKLEQIQELLRELEGLLAVPFNIFQNDLKAVRAAERNFELVVEFASDINTHLLIQETGKTPDSYKRSFQDLKKCGVLADKLASTLAESARLRNILVHEYDFEEDYRKFYNSAKSMLPAYRQYLKAIYAHLKIKSRK